MHRYNYAMYSKSSELSPTMMMSCTMLCSHLHFVLPFCLYLNSLHFDKKSPNLSNLLLQKLTSIVNTEVDMFMIS